MRAVLCVFASLVALAGCGGGSVVLDTAMGPAGAGVECHSSEECRRYTIDGGVGFLGCYAFVGADYCSLPCGPSNGGVDSCWSGSSCHCVEHINAGGFAESDCFCVPDNATDRGRP